MFLPDEVRSLARFRDIADPVERAKAVSAAMVETTTLAAELAALTREAVREMRATMSLAQVAEALGVSRGRVQQLEKPK